MPLADTAAAFSSLGWLVALMFAALVPGVAEAPVRRHAGWLIAFCAARLLVEFLPLLGPALAYDGQRFAAIASASLLWEFARRVWNETRAPNFSWFTHLIALECLAIVGAFELSSTGARPEWFLPGEILFSMLPGLLAGAACFALWRCLDRAVWRVAAVGLALHGIGLAAAPIANAGVLVPWLVGGALGSGVFSVPALRTRSAVVWILALALICLAGPLVVAAQLDKLDRARNEDLLSRAQNAAAPLQGRFAQQLGTREVRLAAEQHLENLRARDPLLHRAIVWKLKDDRAWTLDGAEFVSTRAATPAEKSFATSLRPFVENGLSRGFITVQSPLSAAALETPIAWLALEYPAAFWEVQRQHARRTGIALTAVFAGFCAMGFVLGARQSLETAQRLEAERARSADRAKTEFLAFLSHELRTPLQTILGRAELLRGNSTAARHAEAIAGEGQHLLRLVNDLLDLGVIEAGKLQLQPTAFGLRALLASLEETHGPIAAAKGLALDVAIASDVPDCLHGDDARLRQILGNLLANAVKFTSRGEIMLHVAREEGAPSGNQHVPLVFIVSDSGQGLPPDKIPQLFTLFTRLDAANSFSREGTGVGLALVRRLCDAMGGNVAAANRPSGGAEFTVRLRFPLAPAGTKSMAAISPPAGRALRVLVVEDNAAAREFLVEAATALGHEVSSVADGESALALSAAHPFDAVVLDINLPGRDGIAIARELAARTPRPRLIGCSAEAFAGTRDAALAAGMDAFLEKPVSIGALASAVSAGNSTPAAASLFERLRSPELSAHASAMLAAELPSLVDRLRTLQEAGDTIALQREVHRLRSTALLARDDAIAEICRRLDHAAAVGDRETMSALVTALTPHLPEIAAT